MIPLNLINKIKGKKVAVGLSGGVDSSVTAYLLKKAGCIVTGFYMKNWQDNDVLCNQNYDLKDAEYIANQLNIPFEVINFEKAYHDEVFQEMLKQYKNGWVPNPDIWCNKYIKFEHFFNHIKQMGFEYLATGHYANIIGDQDHPKMMCAKDEHKDQTYFLCSIPKKYLHQILFPLGYFEKKEVRTIARQNHLIVADKKDSTGICFVGPAAIKPFLESYLIAAKGAIINENGDVLGQHDGVIFYTLGQRQGLNIGGIKGAQQKPWFVVEKRLTSNELVISQNPFQGKYQVKSVICQSYNALCFQNNTEVECRTRHGGKLIKSNMEVLDDTHVKINFHESIYHLSLGQWCVLYHQSICIGGGQISEIFYAE